MAREPVRKAVFHAQWISWDDAWKQGQSAGWSLELVATRLRKGLQGEKIPSIDEVITGPGTVETIDLSPEFCEMARNRCVAAEQFLRDRGLNPLRYVTTVS